jgi:hypothetical protein
VELDQGTKARNRAYQERLDEVWRSTAGFEAKLRTEAREATETILNMKEDYQNHINKWDAALQAEINGIFDKLDNELLPAESARVDVIDANLDIFVKTTVPAAIERQSGEVSRQLRRAYETFEIEKKKERKRFVSQLFRSEPHFSSQLIYMPFHAQGEQAGGQGVAAHAEHRAALRRRERPDVLLFLQPRRRHF